LVWLTALVKLSTKAGNGPPVPPGEATTALLWFWMIVTGLGLLTVAFSIVVFAFGLLGLRLLGPGLSTAMIVGVGGAGVLSAVGRVGMILTSRRDRARAAVS
jgi:hypothetical protein